MSKELIPNNEFERNTPIKRMLSGLDSQTAKQLDGRTAKRPARPTAKSKDPAYIKQTFYICRELSKGLHILSIHQSKELSELVNESIKDLLTKHQEKQK
jgi:hypothetical protein